MDVLRDKVAVQLGSRPTPSNFRCQSIQSKPLGLSGKADFCTAPTMYSSLEPLYYSLTHDEYCMLSSLGSIVSQVLFEVADIGHFEEDNQGASSPALFDTIVRD